MAEQTIEITTNTYLSLCNRMEDFERSLSALRGISGGLHFAIDEQQVRGEELENLINLVADRLGAELSAINDEFLQLRRGA
ncbi:MAG: hypothetical protein R3193_07465 [Marinobacter sp.]|nr:hypothetical protein [Marinobacter sp.]